MSVPLELTARQGGPRADALVLDPQDDVATALRDLKAGENISIQSPSGCFELSLCEPIALCHKLSLRPLSLGQAVRKYGEVIGVATEATGAGAHVHTHNLKSTRAKVPNAGSY